MTKAVVKLLREGRLVETQIVDTKVAGHTHFVNLPEYEAYHQRGETKPVCFGLNPHWTLVKRGETVQFNVSDLVVRIKHLK